MVSPKIEQIPKPVRFVPQPYMGMAAVEPFSTSKLAPDTTAPVERSAIMVAELRRPREVLEEYSLDAISMVGSMRKPGGMYAILRVDGKLHNVMVGNYVGQNFGRITQITETEITLRELVKDATNDWVERGAKLVLQVQP